MYFMRILLLSTALVLAISGCGTNKKSLEEQKNKELSEKIELDSTVGAFAEVYSPGEIRVEGYGIVAGLNGRGSSECPPLLREYLIKYIQQMLGNANRYEAIRFFNSNDNAVVKIYGSIPAGASKNDRFDVVVEALAASQTISLAGGMLYTSDLTASSRLGVSGAKKLAIVQGPVYIDWCGNDDVDERKGRVIGGGIAFESSKLYIELKKADYRVSSIIRNRINERFGEKTAVAQSADIIMISPPARYRQQNPKFASLLSSLYIPQTEQSLNARVAAMAEALRMPEDTLGAETGLEAIGRLSLPQLRPLLSDPDELVRLRAARCMLNIGNENAINTLIEIAQNRASQRRLEAINAIGFSAIDSKLLSPLRGLLNDEDFEVSYLAFKILQRNNDLTILRQITMAGFSIDSVVTNGPRRVYISRERSPQIILFGTDIKLNSPLFLKHDPSGLTINALPEDEKIMLMRKDVTTSSVTGPIYSDMKIENMIAKLTDNPKSVTGNRIGLGLDYSTVSAVIKELSNSGAIDAQLHIGNMSEIRPPISAGQQAGAAGTPAPAVNQTE